MTGKRRAILSTAAFVVVMFGGRADAGPTGSFEHAERAGGAIAALDFDEARRQIALGDPGDPAILAEVARLALYEGRCDDALLSLARPEVLRTEGALALEDIARGCVRATAATIVDTDEAHGVVVQYQDEGDRALTPVIVETVVKARDAITRDLGVSWPKPTRVVVVRDLMSLSAMTGLPQKSAETTGTVAVAKWGRVTLLSPRASDHGFPWRDTLAHELTHLAVTHASAEHAPLWLQEGMAKREEVRWRDPGPFDDRPSPDDIVARGMELKLTLPLDQLGPSIAMLPSADAALVAYAEVTSFVRYLASTGPVPQASPPQAGVPQAQLAPPSPSDALPRLLSALRDESDVDAALRQSSGADLHTWDGRWRTYIAAKPHLPLPAIFGLGAHPPDTRDLRDRMRLAELLYGRSHPKSALFELDEVKTGISGDDPSVRSLRAHILGALGRKAEGEPLVHDPGEVIASFGPWWAIRGRWLREDGDRPGAEASFVEAVATDPLDVEAACETEDPASLETDDPGRGVPNPGLCDAARARNEPLLGRD